MTARHYYVYLYSDPETSVPFYVGKGFGARCLKHLTPHTHNRHVRMKMKALREQGLSANLQIIPAADEAAAHRMEVGLIAAFGRRDLGTGSLFNQTNGGEGSSGRVGFRHSEETKAKIGAAFRGKKLSPEHVALLKVRAVGRTLPPHAYPLALEARKRPEVRAAASAAAKRSVTPERLSEMTRRAAEVNKGREKSPQTRERMAEAARQRWARVRAER